MEIRDLNCEEVRQLLDPLVDDELPAHDNAALRNHLQSCSTCRQALHELEALRTDLKQVPRYVAPPSLLDGVRGRLAGEADRSRPVLPGYRTLRAAASHASAMVLGGLLVYGISVSWDDRGLRDQIVAAHVRSLMNGGLVQVSSEDPHTVKPWFAGKIDFAPPVRGTNEEKFSLLGGRVDYLRGRTVAAFVYQYRKHKINVFVFPATDRWTPVKGHSTQSGFNLINWRRGDFSFWAISDLNSDDLTSFANLLAAP